MRPARAALTIAPKNRKPGLVARLSRLARDIQPRRLLSSPQQPTPIVRILRTVRQSVNNLEIDTADDRDFEGPGEQVNNDDAGARAVRSGKSACAPDEANGKFIRSRGAAGRRF